MKPDQAPALDFAPTVVGLLRHAVEHFPDNDFIVEPDQRLTYAEADRLSRALAKRLLLMGVSKGTRVAAKYANSVQWVIAWLAVTRIGGFFMPLSSVYKAGETKKCLRIGDAAFFLTPTHIIGREQGAAVEELLDRPLAELAQPLMIADLPYLRHVVFTSFGPGPYGAIDLAHPDHAEHLLGELHAGEFLLLPLAALHRGVGGRDIAGQREQHRHGVLRGAGDVPQRRVHHHHR